jgi:hypothetical protein
MGDLDDYISTLINTPTGTSTTPLPTQSIDGFMGDLDDYISTLINTPTGTSLPKATPINIYDQRNFRTLAETPEFYKKTPPPTPRRPHRVHKTFNVS